MVLITRDGVTFLNHASFDNYLKGRSKLNFCVIPDRAKDFMRSEILTRTDRKAGDNEIELSVEKTYM